MDIQLSYEHNEELFNILEKLKSRTTTNEAVKETGQGLRGEAYKVISDSGWDGFSRMSSIFGRKKNGWFLRSRPLHRGNFFGIMRSISQEAKNSSLKFGFKSEYGRRWEEGSKTVVTDKMRRFVGLQKKEVRSPVIGTNFFPIKKSTTSIVSPPRPLIKKIYDSGAAWRLFYDNYIKLIERK